MVSEYSIGELIFYVGAVVYFVGMIPGFVVAIILTLKGEMDFDGPPQTYGELVGECFLAATVWFAFLFAYLLECGPKPRIGPKTDKTQETR